MVTLESGTCNMNAIVETLEFSFCYSRFGLVAILTIRERQDLIKYGLFTFIIFNLQY